MLGIEKVRGLLVVVAVLSMGGILSGCGNSPNTDGDGDGDADGDSDGDADGDSDGDADGDSDGDADGDSDGDADGDSDGDADGDADGDTPPVALLELYLLDIWAQPLVADEASLTVRVDGETSAVEGWPVVPLELREASTIDVSVEAQHHLPMEVSFEFDGTTELDGLWTSLSSDVVGMGLSLSHDMGEYEGRSVPIHRVYLGLRHSWFSAQGRPARRGNEIELLMDGEEAWTSVYHDLHAADESIMMTTWWWESEFELYRDATDHIHSTEWERQIYTILDVLEHSTAYKRVLVGQLLDQDGILTWLTSDAELRAHGSDTSDDFEFMGQANETSGLFTFAVAPFLFGSRVRAAFPEADDWTFDSEPTVESEVPPHEVDLTDWPVSVDVQHASYHQKFMIIDDEIGYVGGMNLRRVDWDTSDHYVFESRRMLFDASTEDRLAVARRDREPDTGPRKDYMVRIEGPIVEDLADVFQERWEETIAIGAEYSENATTFDVVTDLASHAGGVQAQITPTLPEPFWEHAIAETWFNAVGMAEDYIFIEDQYFRIPMLVDAIVERMTLVGDLRLIVVTKPVSEWADPGCEWTYETMERLYDLFPDRVAYYQLRAFDYEVEDLEPDETMAYFVNIDVHSKLLIVDDIFMSVGSANKNNRGAVYEGEMNVAILDPDWVRDARRRIFANMLPIGTSPTDSVELFWSQFSDAAAWNESVWEAWDAEGFDLDLNSAPIPEMYLPEGFLYPLVFDSPDECFIEGMGPDMV